MNSIMDNFKQNIKEIKANVDSIYIEENGCVEKCFFGTDKLHQLRSCSKLLIAFAYGIAIHEKLTCKNGDVLTLHTKVYDTLTEVIHTDIDPKVQEWTIYTLLTHSTGYDQMLFSEKSNRENKIDTSTILDRLFDFDIKFDPNTHFTYSNAEPYILSVFFRENFGQDISEFIAERVFNPLGIKQYHWDFFGEYCAGATGLYLSHEDFHKIGKLLMNKGKYDNKQIVPSKWVEEMLKPQIECPEYYKPDRFLPKLSAGYYTWISRDNIVFRDGSEGQYIICDFNNNRLITIMSTETNMYRVTECLRNNI